MTEKRFERIYADVDVFCKDHNAKGVSQLIGREDYDRIVDLLNEQHEQIERLKMNFRVLDEVKCELAEENEQLKRSVQYWYAEHKRIVNNYVDKIKEVEKENKQLKQHNTELINKIDFLERVIDGDV